MVDALRWKRAIHGTRDQWVAGVPGRRAPSRIARSNRRRKGVGEAAVQHLPVVGYRAIGTRIQVAGDDREVRALNMGQ